jgi:PleD family two-component response regulator
MPADFFTLASGAELPPVDPVSASAAKGKRRILIVDDDATSTHLAKILLERSGPYLVLEENDPTKARSNGPTFQTRRDLA